MSFLLDTNVLSEWLRQRPEPAVLAWQAAWPADLFYVSAVTQAEMLLGAQILPAGARRAALLQALEAVFAEDFAQRVLPFDAAAAPLYAEVVARRRAIGRPVSQFDAQIAATARRHGLAVVTRNVADFTDCGVNVIDPWMPST